MSLYRNIAGVPKRMGYLYGEPYEQMQRGQDSGGGSMYPVDGTVYPADYNPEGAGAEEFPVYGGPVTPILPIYPDVPPVLQVQQPNVVNVTTQPGGDMEWWGLVTLAGITYTMLAGSGKGWAPWLLAGGCGILYWRMKQRQSLPVGIEPVRTQ